MTIKELKQGDYFKLKNTPTSPVWVRGEYVRKDKSYCCYRFDDVNHYCLMKGTREVYEPENF